MKKSLPDACFIASEGRSFPVEISYQAPSINQHWREHLLYVLRQNLYHQGSILVFLPGVSDIRFLINRLIDHLPAGTLLCPLFGSLTLAEQQQAIIPCESHEKKIVLATNIAETSLTIEGINLVIDCGLEKVAIYDTASLLNKLVQKNIAKASATQRAGRAGRLSAGHCLRLYAQEDFDRRPEQGIHDIQQADLLPTLIEAARWGVSCLADLSLLELPDSVKEHQAWLALASLAIVDKKQTLTAHGVLVAALPCHPRFGHMLVCAHRIMVSDNNDAMLSLACLLAALLEERDIFAANQARFDANIEHRIQLLCQIGTGNARQSTAINGLLKQANVLAKRFSHRLLLDSLPLDKIGLLLSYAYPERIAKARGAYGNFICANGKGACVNDQDTIAQADFLVLADLGEVQGQIRVRLAASISLIDIEQAFSQEIVEQDIAMYDDKTNRITHKKQRKLSALVLSERLVSGELSSDHISQMWCDLVSKKGLKFLPWQSNDLALRSRWLWITTHLKNLQLPLIDDRYLLANLDSWLAPFVGEVKSKTQLSKVDLSAMLLSLLTYAQQKLLQQAAPSHYVGGTGRHCPITYGQAKSPKVSLPMQELYGLTQTPIIGGSGGINEQGIPLLLELLSPAQRPIQLTQDLVQFWTGSYKAVQKEMKSCYPRHYWPDDPASAQATNKTKRHMKSS